MEDKVRLYHGDCLEVMKQIPDKSVDMVLTDIPYGEVNRESGGLRKLDKGLADVCELDLEKMLDEYKRLVKETIYIFCGTEQVSELRAGLVKRGFSTRLCIWEKTNPSPMNGTRLWLSSIECCVFARLPRSTFNEHCKSAVWKNPIGRSKVHPTEKPVQLMDRLVRASSDIGMTVLDNCMGSGTTGVVCVNTDRKFVGIEKDPTYFELAKQRIENAQNKRAESDWLTELL